jgi:hypothetical protein
VQNRRTKQTGTSGLVDVRPPSAHRRRVTNTRLNKPRLRPIHTRRQRACDIRGATPEADGLGSGTANSQPAVSQPGGKKSTRSFGSAICEGPPPCVVGFDLPGSIPMLPMQSASRTEQIPRRTRDSSSSALNEHYVGQTRLKTANARQSSGLIGDTGQILTPQPSRGTLAHPSQNSFYDPDKWGELFTEAYVSAKHPGVPARPMSDCTSSTPARRCYLSASCSTAQPEVTNQAPSCCQTSGSTTSSNRQGNCDQVGAAARRLKAAVRRSHRTR